MSSLCWKLRKVTQAPPEKEDATYNTNGFSRSCEVQVLLFFCSHKIEVQKAQTKISISHGRYSIVIKYNIKAVSFVNSPEDKFLNDIRILLRANKGL